MDEQTILIYCLCGDLLKAMHYREDSQCQMSDAEVVTTALVAARFFGGNMERARHLLSAPHYIPHMLSKSRFNRRLHRIKPFFFYQIEDELRDLAQIELLPMRKQNSSRPLPPYMRFLQYTHRKIVETTASLVERLLPKSIHAVTAPGFELKVVLFILACSISYIVGKVAT